MIRRIRDMLVTIVMTATFERMTFVKQMSESILWSLNMPHLRVFRQCVLTWSRSDLALVATATRPRLSVSLCLLHHLGYRLIDSLFHTLTDVLLECVELSCDRVSQLIDRDVRHREPPP